jgi:hypothetical protein
MAVKKVEGLRFNMIKFKQDYNDLEAGGFMSLIYLSVLRPTKFNSRFAVDGLFAEADYRIRYYPVLANEALTYLGAAKVTDLSKREFINYANHATEVLPNRFQQPNLAKFDEEVPRRSNKHFASDTLPRVDNVYQIYIQKLSSKTFKLPNQE